MGIKNVVKKIGGKAGDKVAQLSSLSPAQVENVQLLKIFIFQLRTKRSTEKNLMMRITFDI